MHFLIHAFIPNQAVQCMYYAYSAHAGLVNKHETGIEDIMILVSLGFLFK